ncbi:ATP-dependent protease [Clostridium sporogenes]|uniref:AAA family ATPase n=1 Tax=Clostridium sporogenes TaxID=1509 RepID=UPI0013D309C3|nr:AAA family ATPase [Clostridium sporogenes]NFV12168.1 ATP-dependent protease [Clostridium sporogenes]
MLRKINSKDLLYNLELNDINIDKTKNYTPEYNPIFEKINLALDIDKPGYNLYLVDDFSKEKLDSIMNFINEKLEKKEKPKDICYVVLEEERYPYSIYLENGMGKVLKEKLEYIQEEYNECIYEFYNKSSNKEKEIILESMDKKRNEIVNELIEESKKEGFEIKTGVSGFVFMPIRDGKALSENEYEDLSKEEKEEIVEKVSKLKEKAEKYLEILTDMETKGLEDLRDIMKIYFEMEMKSLKEEYRKEFEDNIQSLDFLNSVCRNIENELIENYTSNYEDDQESIVKCIYKYKVNVIVDNTLNKSPLVIFEENPSVNNLIGSIEYESKNGVYYTDTSLIKAGSLLKANEGCLIVRANSLLTNGSAYFYLKKALINDKIDFDYNRGYLELLSLGGLKPEPIKTNLKVIIIGDYEVYNLLYNYDEDFKKIFKLKSEYNKVVDINSKSKEWIFKNIYYTCEGENLKNLNEEAVKEVCKYLSRKAENKNKFYFDKCEIDKLLIQADNRAKIENRDVITKEDIQFVAYEKEEIEKEVMEEYEKERIFIDIKGKKIGQVNGLSVVDLGYASFGRPIRITCCCYKGNGNIIDIQKESDLSGNIHNKAISILKGYINSIIGKYDTLPVDFHLSFEQIYGKVDGDSASVAEAIAMLSALSNMPITQSIAVTGSINQFGQVQPIGGVNDKIEGFYEVCKYKNDIQGKGILIPETNREDLVLNKEVEEAIKKGEFTIYTMENLEDAAKILLGEKNFRFDNLIEEIEKELKKYNKKSKKYGKIRL